MRYITANPEKVLQHQCDSNVAADTSLLSLPCLIERRAAACRSSLYFAAKAYILFSHVFIEVHLSALQLGTCPSGIFGNWLWFYPKHGLMYVRGSMHAA